MYCHEYQNIPCYEAFKGHGYFFSGGNFDKLKGFTVYVKQKNLTPLFKGCIPRFCFKDSMVNVKNLV